MFLKTISVVVILVIGSVFYACINSTSDYQNKKRPSGEINLLKKTNDKIVVITGIDYDTVRKASEQFCNLYNNDSLIAIPQLIKVLNQTTVIKFPYDISFERFCYFVNYMYYPHNIFYKADIKAWTTVKKGDEWIKDNIA